jgi:DNA-binding transcriptional LysR family regulator
MHAAALAYFRETARLGSIRKAAGHLNVAASALNRQILKLEAEFGTPLFDRLPGGMRLTAAGELLLRHVTTTFHDYDRVRAEIDDLREARSGHVTIVAVDSLLVDFLPRVIDRFRADFPAVTLTVLAVQPSEVPEQLADGRADIGFTFVGQMVRSVQLIAEIPAPLGVIMPVDHPLAGKRIVSFEDVRGYPFLAQAGPLPRSADIDPDFSAFRAQLVPRITSNSIQMLKRAIRLGMGIAFFTRLGFLEEIERGELVWRPFASDAINKVGIGLLTATGRPLNAPARQLVRQIIDDIARLGES